MAPNLFKRWSQIVLLLCCNSAFAAADGVLFESDEVLDIELRGPLEATIRDTRRRDKQGFVLRVGDRAIDVAVSVRGNSRVRVCRFPPLRLDFSGSDAAATEFSGQGKLKLVTHCKDSRTYEQNVLEEFAAYRVFRMMSEVGFRVRLLRIRYVDTGKSAAKPVIRYGFVIESEAALAERVQGEVLHAPHVVRSLLKAEQAASVFVFHYLIGSTDWSLVTANTEDHCCHNGDLVKIGGLHYLVPYDFDQSGLVNARYAKPDPSVGIRSVRTRRYRGYCIEGVQVDDAITRLAEMEAEILDLMNSLPGGTEKDYRYRRDYLQKFFAAAGDDGKLSHLFGKRCIG